MRKPIGLALLTLAATLAHAGELSSKTKNEIDALLSKLGTSECRFFRNGSWHTGSEAKNHLQMKLDYFVKKGGISSAEDFIEKAATKSNSSGKPYLVRCPNQTEQPCSVWLGNALRKFREVQRK